MACIAATLTVGHLRSITLHQNIIKPQYAGFFWNVTPVLHLVIWQTLLSKANQNRNVKFRS